MFCAFVAFCAIHLSARSAEQYSEISPKLGAYCSLYARQMVFIKVMHPVESITADSDVILGVAKQEYQDCLSVLPTLLPLPKELGSLNQWLADMREIIILRARTQGIEPATEQPVVPVNLKEEEWKEQCRAEYVSWDEATGTVLRRGNPERVRCPCGGEVQCGG